MQKFIARQPILDTKENIFGYELLFRRDEDNFCISTDSNLEASNVMVDSVVLYGIDGLAGRGRAFFNCSRESLVQGHASLLPRDRVVLEVLESVEADAEVVKACAQLKEKGFLIALDDFHGERQAALTSIADILKIDFLATSPEERQTMMNRYRSANTKFLAEKVETRTHFKEALAEGYSYFQGYFFSKPEMLTSNGIPGSLMAYLRALQSVAPPVLSMDEVSNAIKLDLSLSYKLLRFLNSPAFAFRTKINSIKHALTLLGEDEIRKWVSLVALTSLGERRPPILVATSLIRAAFCEMLAHPAAMAARGGELFLLGLLSNLDAVLNRPMAQALKDLIVGDDIRSALTGKPVAIRRVLDLVTCYERGQWSAVSQVAAQLKIEEESLPMLYLKAIEWSRQIYID